MSAGWGEDADLKYCNKPGLNFSDTGACQVLSAVGHSNALGQTQDNSSVFNLIFHYSTLKSDKATKLWLFQIIHNFSLKKSFVFHILQTCTLMRWLLLLQREKSVYLHLQGSESICVCIFCTVGFFTAVITERKHASLVLNEQRKPREEAAGSATSTRECKSGAEGDHNRGRGSALTDQGRSTRYSNRKSRAGLVTETRVSHSPQSPKSSHGDKAGLMLGQGGKPVGQVQQVMWLGTGRAAA